MSYVQGPAPLNGPEGISPRINRAEEFKHTSKTDPEDQVDISELARWKSKLAELPSIREDLVAEVREELEDGTYETREKIDIAASRILEELEE